MAGRIVLFGATGYTGRLVAEAMVERGLHPVLAARSRDKLEQLADELGGGLETAEADVSKPATVGALVERGDVLLSTVGPFVRYGAPAAAAAATHGAHYIDSTGEPPFIQQVFERYHEGARKSGAAMLTAFGYDFVPGNLAGALALEQAGERAVRVDVGYFFTGKAGSGAASGGTLASLAGIATAPAFAYRDGRVRPERSAARERAFDVKGQQRRAIAIGASEHFALPRLAPGLREVNAYLGWFGPASRVLPAVTMGSSVLMKLPGAESAWEGVVSRFLKGSTGGPDEEARSKSGSHVVGIAYDAAGHQLAEVHVSGVNGYTFTGRILAWGAEQAAAGALKGTGALGPADGFGLRELERGCAEAGLTTEGARPASRDAAEQPAQAGA